MKLTYLTFRGEPLFVPFVELGDKYARIDNNAPFKRTLRCGREFEIRRSDYLDAPVPMATGTIGDAAMELIATALQQELDTYIDGQTDDDAFDDALCREEENLLCEIGVPYYEDDTPKNYSVGDRVFLMRGKRSCYATIVKLHPSMEEMTVKTDGGDKVRVANCDVVKEF